MSTTPRAAGTLPAATAEQQARRRLANLRKAHAARLVAAKRARVRREQAERVLRHAIREESRLYERWTLDGKPNDGPIKDRWLRALRAVGLAQAGTQGGEAR